MCSFLCAKFCRWCGISSFSLLLFLSCIGSYFQKLKFQALHSKALSAQNNSLNLVTLLADSTARSRNNMFFFLLLLYVRITNEPEDSLLPCETAREMDSGKSQYSLETVSYRIKLDPFSPSLLLSQKHTTFDPAGQLQ